MLNESQPDNVDMDYHDLIPADEIDGRRLHCRILGVHGWIYDDNRDVILSRTCIRCALRQTRNTLNLNETWTNAGTDMSFVDKPFIEE